MRPWPHYSEEEIEAVVRVLRSGEVNYWTGDEGRRFEADYAAHVGVGHAITLANGTLALDLALHGLKVGARNGGTEADEVIVTPRSFIASASCVVNAGAKPVFADVEFETQCLSAQTISPRLTSNTKAIILVHLGGWPADLDPIIELGLPVIEDCAQAHGAFYKGRPVGGIGTIGAFSFCQDKIISTGGEGGMVTTNDPALFERMWSFKDHGKARRLTKYADSPPAPVAGFNFSHEYIGTNMRMTEMQAAIGRIQLARLSETTARRTEAASQLDGLLEAVGVSDLLRAPTLPDYGLSSSSQAAEQTKHAHYRSYRFLTDEAHAQGLTNNDLIAQLKAADTAIARLKPDHGGSAEIYREGAFSQELSLPNAKRLAQDCIGFRVLG